MLTWNVAGLLRSAPGDGRTYDVHEPDFTVAGDLRLALPLDGRVRLMLTGRGLLVHAVLSSAFEETCSRCLGDARVPVEVTIDEEALPSIDIDGGQPLDTAAEPDALRIDDHHELDLTEPVRAALSLEEPIAPLCRPDCAGLCETCGADLNADPEHGHAVDAVDPRLAVLAGWEPAVTD
jgi:uncharacterized protein